MQQDLESVFDLVQAAVDLGGLQASTEAARDALGVAHVVYHWVNSRGERFGAGTYSQEWVDRYLEMDYLRMDPVIIGGLQRFDPYSWKELDWSSRAAQSFLKEAIAFGVGNQGFTIPVRGPSGQFALFTTSHHCSDAEWEAAIADWQRGLILLAHEFNRKALEFEKVGQTPMPMLSPRELAAMTYLAKGMNRAQAAQQMSISEHTLRVYIEAARHKLGALNTTHAVARALSRGLIVV